MKKNFVFYIVALAALLTTACTREIFPGEEERGFGEGETGLVMSVSGMAPQTRAIAPPDSNNEYTLEQYYYFIYKENPATVATAVPVFVGKWTGPEAPASEEPAPTVIGEENIALDNLTVLKSGTTYSGYVFVLANYKVPATLAVWDAIIAAQGGTTAPDYSALTWSYFQALELPKPTFNVYKNISSDATLWPKERYDEKADVGDRFQPQDSFVMTSADAQGNMAPISFSVQEKQKKVIDAPLKRVAAKLSLNINLAKWYVQTNNGTYKYTWYSHPERLQIYLNYAADAGRLDGTPMTYTSATAANFFPYSRFAHLTKYESLDATTGKPIFPDGSYDERIPCLWKYKETPAASQPESDGQYYTNEQDLVGNMVVIDGEVRHHTITRPAYKLTGTPFYSYPYDFSADSGHAPFFKVIVEWTAYNEPENDRATDEAAGKKNTMVINQEPFYYKILFPNQTLFSANKWYTINLNVSTLGSEADDAALDLVGQQGYYVVDWSSPEEAEKMNLHAGRYLSVTSDETEEINGEDVPVFHMYGGAPFEVPMTSSHEVKILNAKATYEKFKSPTGTQTLAGSAYTIEPKSLNTVELTHELETTVTAMNAPDVSIITYTFTLHHADLPVTNTSFDQKVRVYQYPSIYISQEDGDNVFLDGYFQHQTVNPFDRAQTGYGNSGYRSRNQDGSSSSAGSNGNAGNVQTPYGALGYDGGLPKDMTLVTVSAFTSKSIRYNDGHGTSADYLIADPRVLANSAPYAWNPAQLTRYLTNQTGNNYTMSYGQWNAVSNIANLKVATRENSNFIAPAFLISSRWGRPGNNPFPADLETAEKRCATYQEAGYPAGRWRLPTEAEVFFVYQLQDRNLVDGLFTGGNGSYGYWVSSGRLFAEDGNLWFKPVSQQAHNQGHSVRCVYDYWYWGDEKVNENKFTPKP